ncbi:MAG: efflux RND transporter periplasmic adaptor subunit [Rhizobacter sp.]|nr:efflux RND transporter periplasmic adaptor subunit [Rhizobacter sp.]
MTTSKRRRLWVSGILVAGVVAGIGLAVVPGRGNGAKDAAGPDGKKPEATLEFTAAEVVRPQLASMPLVVQFSGPLVAPRTAVIRAKSAGTLLSLRVNEGSRVKAGQRLGEIDLADLQSRVNERSAAVESAQAALVEAERQHTANVGLASQNFISPTALQSSQARLDSARAQLKSAQAQLATVRLGVKEAALVSPIAGIVGKRHVVPGEKVSAEQQLLTVVDLSSLELAATVGTHEVSQLRPGQAVQVSVEGAAQPVTGRLDRIAPSAEAGSRSIGVVVTLDNQREQFRAGQYALGKVVLPDETQRLTLPASAIGSTSGQDQVWVIDGGTLQRRAVTTGRRDESHARVEVLKGLAPGATVLAARFDNLRDGAKAVVAGQAASAPGSGPAVSVASSASGASVQK